MPKIKDEKAELEEKWKSRQKHLLRSSLIHQGSFS